MGHIGGSLSHREGVGRIRRHLRAVLRPFQEGVTWIGRDIQGAGLAIIVGTCTCNGAAACRVARSRNLVSVLLEMSYIGAALGHREGVAGIGRHLRAVLRPIDEMVTCGRCGGQRAVLVVVEHTVTRDGTAFGRVGCGIDYIADTLEAGHIGGTLCHRKGVGGIGRHLRTVLHPTKESVACSWRGNQCASGSMGEGATTRNSTIVAWGDRSGDGIAVLCEVGNVSGCLGHREGIGSIGRHLVAVLRPFDEVVACGRCGHQGAGRTLCVATGTCDSTSCSRVGRGGDIIHSGGNGHRNRVGGSRHATRIAGLHIVAVSTCGKVVIVVGGSRLAGANAATVPIDIISIIGTIGEMSTDEEGDAVLGVGNILENIC